jgi:uncharacterized protein YndB with AHSA1/START domain
VAQETLRFERDYAFPRVIVWDALVDADLVSGWLAEAVIDPEVGGRYDLTSVHRPGHPMTRGRIAEFAPHDRLGITIGDGGQVDFELEEVPGGNRGTSTRLRLSVQVEVEPAFVPVLKADWLTNLDQLHDLLFGHPVDWANWGPEMHETWAQHRDEVRNSTA